MTLEPRRDSLFFVPSPSEALGLFRFFFYFTIFFIFADNTYFLDWREVPLELWRGQGFTEFLKPLLTSYQHEFVFRLWQVSLIGAAFGLFTRWMSVIAFVTSFLLIAYAQSFGYFTRLFMPILWALFFMAFAKSGESYSLDQKMKKKVSSPAPSPEYGWPLQAMRIIFCVLFFQAGLSKLVNGGLEWLNGQSLQNYILYSYVWPFNAGDRLNFSFHKFFFDHLWICQVGSVFVVLIELAVPLAYFSKKLRGPLVLSLALMQVLTRFTILVNFSGYIPLYLAWLPWDQISRRWDRK